MTGAPPTGAACRPAGQSARPIFQPPPPYAAPLPVPGGTLDVDDPWYLPRPTDATALSVARQPGQTLTIKGPRQMGKSSLLMRTVKAGARRRQEGRAARLPARGREIEGGRRPLLPPVRRRRSPSSSSCPTASTSSGIPGFSNPQNCTRYVERHVLQPLDAPCVIAIDETDSIFRTAFSADFFAMLRSWHGLRAHPVRRSWKKLDIILSTSTEPQFFIDRPHESPFNVGVVLPLEDFLPEQVARLNALHPRPLGDADVQRLYALVGGHPYLTRKALYVRGQQCADDARSRSSFAQATDDAGPFGDHLRYYLLRLQGKPELISALPPGDRAAQRRRRAAHSPAAGGRPGAARGEERRAALRAVRPVFPRAPA